MLKTLRKEACGGSAPGSQAPGRKCHYKGSLLNAPPSSQNEGVNQYQRSMSTLFQFWYFKVPNKTQQWGLSFPLMWCSSYKAELVVIDLI